MHPLGFLFMEGNTMWGGNIPSMLAGTFCYSLGFAFAILYLGLLFYSFMERKPVLFLFCALLLAVIGFCHGYTLLFVGYAASFFLFTKKFFRRNFKILLFIHIMTFCLMAFWLLPLLAFSPNTTPFTFAWIFYTWKQLFNEVFPKIIYPFIGVSVLTTFIILYRYSKKNATLK